MKVSRDLLLKDVTILVVTIAGKGDDPVDFQMSKLSSYTYASTFQVAKGAVLKP